MGIVSVQGNKVLEMNGGEDKQFLITFGIPLSLLKCCLRSPSSTAILIDLFYIKRVCIRKVKVMR